MNDELKACPFCGAKLTKSVVDRETFYQHPMVNGCHLRAMLFTKYKWNTRPIEDALRLRIAELEESDKHWAGNVKVCMQLIERYESDVATLEAENAELKGRAENAEQMVSRLLEVGSALEAQAYDAWIKDGMLDFPAAKDWELLINEIKETKKESEK